MCWHHQGAFSFLELHFPKETFILKRRAGRIDFLNQFVGVLNVNKFGHRSVFEEDGWYFIQINYNYCMYNLNIRGVEAAYGAQIQ